jgi:hypothetical protein
MSDPAISLYKINELLLTGSQTKDLVGRAAIFSAVAILVNQLDEYMDDDAVDAGENLERLRWHSAAMLGYDLHYRHTEQQHYCLALDALQILEHLVFRQADG